MMSYDVKLTPVDKQTKAAFAQVCEEAGLSPKEALSLFTKSVAAKGDIPFDIKAMQLSNTMFGEVGEEHFIVDDDMSTETEKTNRFFNEMMGI
jgi:addiction module RelB/DinJ family antitoxin